MARTDRAFDDAVDHLEQLYATLPALTCLGLCDDSCHTRIDASTVERRRLQDAGVDLDEPTPDGHCPALRHTFGTGRCAAHPIRPMVCRLWGISAALPCPHGCTPDGGHASDHQTLQWLITSMRIGGHPTIDPRVQEVLERATADPATAGLLARFLRGDRTIVAELYSRLTRSDRAQHPPAG